MTSSPDRLRAEFSGISTRTWDHPADRTALVTLRSLTGFDVVLRTYRANFDQSCARWAGMPERRRALSHPRSAKGGSATGERRELTFSG